LPLLESTALTRWLIVPLGLVCAAFWLAARHRGGRPASRAITLGGAVLLSSAAALELLAGCWLPPARGPREDCRGVVAALKDCTAKEGLWLVIGDEKLAMLPVAAGRKSRWWTNADAEHAEEALRALEQERIEAVLVGPGVAGDGASLANVLRRLSCDPQPTFGHPSCAVHLSRFLRGAALARLGDGHDYAGVSIAAGGASDGPVSELWPVAPGSAAAAFPMISPHPVLFHLAFGYMLWSHDGAMVLGTNSDSAVVIVPPPAAQRIRWEFGLLPGAYEAEGRSDGVEFLVEAERQEGGRRTVFRRVLDPFRHERDRGVQAETISFTPCPGERLVFSALRNGNHAYDWAFWKRIVVE